MFSSVLPAIGLAFLAGACGAAVALLWLRWFLLRQADVSDTDGTDPYVAAEIDAAALKYATEHGRPELASIVADKLHLLHRIGARRRRWQP